MNKISSKELVEIFESKLLQLDSYKRLGILTNPCHFYFDGIEFYAYVKNLSFAHLKGSADVWRAQLTGVARMNEIKLSDATFILLGYDAENNVYATWNPFKAKQRIGTSSSPSFYSRLSLQQEAGLSHMFHKRVLANDLEVLLFRTDLLPEYLVSINEFFPDSSDYVAIGSKKRTEANEAYRQLIDIKRIAAFEDFLVSKGINESKVYDFAFAIRKLISSNMISQNRIVFLKYNSLEEYTKACVDFFALDELNTLDKESDGLFSSALFEYITFLQDKKVTFEQESALFFGVREDESHYGNECELEQPDWEKDFIDKQGCLTRIVNPDLLNKLRIDLDTEYPSLPSAYNTVQDFYENRFPAMEMKDWSKLFKEINWTLQSTYQYNS